MKGKDSKQTKLKLDEIDKEKKVKFSQGEEKFKHELLEIRLETRREIEILRKAWEEKFKMLEERIIKIE